jgi:hypothetical protein
MVSIASPLSAERNKNKTDLLGTTVFTEKKKIDCHLQGPSFRRQPAS